ncbi:MAG TPA: hypothetical protein VF062_00530 [Candidatus Limnocylindrales bacterium]
MRTSRRLTLLTLAVSMTAIIGAVASPSVAEDPRSGPVVLTKLSPEVTLEEMHAKAEQIRGERLPAQALQLTVVESQLGLSADQIATVVARKEAEGSKWLGDVSDPSPGTTLQAIGRQIGWDDVVLWECYPVLVIIGGYVYVVWVCRPLILRA